MRKYCDFTIDYFQDEDGVFIAQVPALPGCAASGKTFDEAYENIKAAIESCVEVRRKINMPVSDNRYENKNIYRLPVTA